MGQPPYFIAWCESSMKMIRVSKTTALKTCAIPRRLVIFVATLLIVTGCTMQRAPSKMKAESAAPAVKMVIYTDFQCGACERFHTQVEPELRARYVVSGKARIETRVVGALGPDSLRAGEAALCVADQGLFPEYQKALFATWRQIDGYAYSDEELVRLAGTLGLDMESLRHCLDGESKRPELEKNLKMAEANGVHTLPAVFISGVKIEGNRPLGVYTRVMERTLTARLSQ